MQGVSVKKTTQLILSGPLLRMHLFFGLTMFCSCQNAKQCGDYTRPTTANVMALSRFHFFPCFYPLAVTRYLNTPIAFWFDRTNGPMNPLWDRWFEGPRESKGCSCWIF